MITLYHHGSSVCAGKVRLVLAEKSAPWQGIYIDILRGDQFDPAYMKLNPKAVVPTLLHDDKVIVESSVICEYLDEVFAAPALKPAAAAQRAAMRLWTKAVDEYLHPACAELTFASCHRFIIGRLPPEKFNEFLESTPPISVTADWHARKKEMCARAWPRRASTGPSGSTTVICRKWKTRWQNRHGSPAMRYRSPTSPWRPMSTGSICSACRKCGSAAAHDSRNGSNG